MRRPSLPTTVSLAVLALSVFVLVTACGASKDAARPSPTQSTAGPATTPWPATLGTPSRH
ncbi:hypothetical protein QMK19_20040 [Streptomyces sp. H10-C2]|uniref:hypothetical protein n=1 Tax=unclassified Streptomyces TaxID=2593676 RepID=UPI0024B9F07E|nr:MULTISPECIES: hypothetical protein [unclassified Streptomyces]MDJ0344845.1 hypothetical protein [Streptomyces sp. PH10-H1]MDJ0371905.1 hypothetical protein [Streptomyces sp. H10-C2]